MTGRASNTNAGSIEQNLWMSTLIRGRSAPWLRVHPSSTTDDMRTVTNKTPRPLTVPLPRGKKLHLGPLKTGQITTEAADHAALKKLVDAGEIEISEEQLGTSGPSGGPGRGRGAEGHAHGGGNRRSGDR